MLDDRLLEDLLAQQAAAGAPARPDPLRRAGRLIAAAALVPAVVLGLLGLLGGVLTAVVVFVVVLVLVGGGLSLALLRPREARLAAAIGGRPADPVTDARLLNLVEGLCTASGLRVPAVRVIEADGLNALAAGRDATSATLAVTTGLLSQLNRIELEGVLAEEVVSIRQGRMVPATIAASVPPMLARLLPAQRDPEIESDRAAVGMTRYPPGLRAALQKMEARGTAVRATPRIDGLWLAAPRLTAETAVVRVPLSERIAALAEL